MNKRQISHGLKIADDARRVRNERQPGSIVRLKSQAPLDVYRILDRIKQQSDPQRYYFADFGHGPILCDHLQDAQPFLSDESN